MTLVSMVYKVPLTLLPVPIPCISHAVFTDQSPRPSVAYLNSILRNAFTARQYGGLFFETVGAYNCFSNETIDWVKRLREAREVISRKYFLTCELTLEEELSAAEMDSKSFYGLVTSFLDVRVCLQGRELVPAARNFIAMVGAPYFVNNGSNYEIVDIILGEQGLKTKRTLRGCFAGKQVVPASL